MSTDTDVPVKKKKADGDLRPSALTVAQALVDLADGRYTTATNADLAAATGLGKAQHNAVSIARALRAMSTRGLIRRTYDQHTRQRTIEIVSDDLAAAVKKLLA